MTLSLTHTFVSAKSDDADATLVRPSNWNAEHTITLAANKIVGAITAGVAVEIDCTSAGRALIDDADAAAQRTTLGLTALATTTPGTNVATFLATPTSANLAAALTDETGSGALVFGTAPTLTSPAIGGTGAVFNTYLRVWTNDASNTLIGNGAGQFLVTPATSHNGDGNTLVGSGAGANMTTAFATTIVGGQSGYNLTGGDSNTIFGYQCGGSMVDAKWNVLIGVDCMALDVSARDMVVIGHHAGGNLTHAANTGESVYVGSESIKVGVGGVGTVAVGYRTAYNSNASAVSNVLIGHLAGFTNTSGSQLTAVGKDALFSNTTGVYNNAFGYRTLYNTTDGDNNCAFGDFAGFTNTTGNYNVFFGANAGFYETGSSKLYIDNTARASEAAGRANALVYGVFGTSPTDQTLQINGKLIAYGTPTNDSAAAGQIGEFIESTLGYSSRTTLTTSTGTNITSISLTAGDWDVSGQVVFEKDTTTTLSYQIGSLSTTSVTLGSEKQQATITNLATGFGQNSCVIPQQRISLASTTTIYLVAQAAFTVSFCKAYGAIFARRAR